MLYGQNYDFTHISLRRHIIKKGYFAEGLSPSMGEIKIVDRRKE